MSKKFTKLIAAFALLVFMMPSLAGWGQTRTEEVYKQTIFNSTNNSTSVSGYSNSWYNTTDNFRNDITNANNNSNQWEYIKIGHKSTAYTGTLITHAAIDEPITKVVMNIGAINSYVTSMKLYTSTNGSSWTETGTFDKSTGNKEVALANPTANLYYKIEVVCTTGGSSNGHVQINKIEYYHNTGSGTTVATPTFDPAGGDYTTTQNVTISCETQGSTIYYTTDGSTPDNTSTEYTGAITVSETTTLKAIAYVGNDASSVASATYTIVTPLTTMQAIFDRATAIGSTAQTVTITFNNWVVSGKSASYAYVTDGTKGFVITNYGGHGFDVGDVLSGTSSCLLRLNYGYANLQNFSSTAEGLTVNPNGTVEIANIDMADLSGVNSGALVHYDNLTCSKSGSNYYLTDGTTTIQVYTTLYSGFTSVLQDGKNYNITGVYQQYNTTKEICPRSAADIVEYVGPSIEATPSPFTAPSYVLGTTDPTFNVLTVNGSNLTANISLSLGANSNFEMSTDLDTWSSSLTLTQANGSVTNAEVAIRLKAGLAKGNYVGTVALSSTDAQNVEVSLSGTVTGEFFDIVLTQPATGGTIASDLEAAEEGTTVTLTATPDAAYNFGSWVVEDVDGSPIVVTNNQFEMPAIDVLVTATFTLKDTYAITCAVTPEGAALMEASPVSAYEGQTVTLSYVAETGYTFSGIVITKTEDGSATGITPTASGDDYTFTMPGYAVTATATFTSNTFAGSFVKVTGLNALEDGGYYILYDEKAMNSTITSGKMGATAVEIEDDVITDPDNSIVWKLNKVTVDNNEYWDLYSEKEGKCCYISSTNSATAFAMLVNAIYHFNVSTYDDGGFRFKTTASTGRCIGFNGSDDFRSYANSNDPEVYLYKYTELTERTITFNGNGGETENEETTYTQTVYDGIAANLTANQFTYGSSIFMGWSTTQNGEVEYADEAPITVTGDVTLYAKWETGYTAMVDDEIDGGFVYIVTATGNEEIIEAAAGTEITLTYTADLGYAFSAWNVYYTDENEQIVPVEVSNNNKFNMPAYDVTISAGFEEVTTYSLVTNIDQIVSGKHYIIVGKKDGVVKAMGYDKGNNRHAVLVTETNNQIAETEGVYEFVINGPIEIDETNYYTIYDTNENSTGYLYAPGGNSNNYLKTQPINDNKGQWTIAIAPTTSVATIVANVSGKNKMQYNASNTIFSCYSTTQQEVYLYVKVNDTDLEYYGSEITYSGTSITEGTITVGTGSVMTVPAGFTNNDPDKLIVKDGGQLITHNAVQATVQKNITGVGETNWAASSGADGWYFVASPVNGASFSTAATGDYDLYMLDWANNKWRNIKNAENASLFANGFQRGTGYLYASKGDNTISVEGEIQPLTAANTATVTLATDGWNLIGNSLTCKVSVDKAFSELTNASAVTSKESGSIIDPGQGIAVWGNADDVVTFTRANTQDAAALSNSALQMTVAQTVITRGNTTSTTVDNAIVSFTEGSVLPKFNMLEGSARLYIPQGTEEYAIVSSEAQGEMPVNFRANANGQYTLTVNPENVEMNYLHLIDNMTGADVDLLQEPSYTFNANVTDYESRFRLVFASSANGNENDSESFAFLSNGQLIIANEGQATLQVIDITGRILSSETINGSCSKSLNAPAGVYMLRLINGNDVKVQKIVVR